MATPTLAESLTAATAAVVATGETLTDLLQQVALREANAVQAAGLAPGAGSPMELAEALALGVRFEAVAGGSVNALAVRLPAGMMWPAMLSDMEFMLPTLGVNTGPVTVAVAGFTVPPAAVANSGQSAGTLQLRNRSGGQLVAGDLTGAAVRVRFDGAGSLRLNAATVGEMNLTVKNYLAAQPPYRQIFVDPISGSETNDGSTSVLARKDIDAVLDGVGTTTTNIILLNDATIRRRRNIYASLSIYGGTVVGQSYADAARTITFLGNADNSPNGALGTFCSGLWLVALNFNTYNISFALPVQPAGQNYSAHIFSNSGSNISVFSATLTVAGAAAGQLFGSVSNPLSVYAGLALGSGAAGHIFQGIVAGANPNIGSPAFYRTNITSG